MMARSRQAVRNRAVWFVLAGAYSATGGAQTRAAQASSTGADVREEVNAAAAHQVM